MIDWDDDIPEEDEAEDPIIELTDIVNPDQDNDEAESVIELTDIVTTGEDIQDTVSMEETAMEDIDQGQIAAALERVIEKKFSGKIETILFEVMEKVIEKEITEIKESLQRDLDQIGNA